MMKVVLTGPESVGKSTLTKQLSEFYNGVYVEEFARNYVEQLGRPYTYNDVEFIVQQQLKEYDDFKNQKGFCFFDTFLIISKIWFLHVYHRLPEWFEDEFMKRPVDLYLLCKDDLEWESDGVRENEKLRRLLFDKYKDELDKYGFRYVIIEGEGENRLKKAIEVINNVGNNVIVN